MYYYDDSPFSALCDVVMLGLFAFGGYKAGQRNAYHEMENQRREEQFRRLEKMIEELDKKHS